MNRTEARAARGYAIVVAQPPDDATLVARLTERLTEDLARNDAQFVRRTVREELDRLRRGARVQNFVPVLTERNARLRLTVRPGRGKSGGPWS